MNLLLFPLDKPWGQLLPLVDIDADVFNGLEGFENEFVINFTDASKEQSFTLASFHFGFDEEYYHVLTAVALKLLMEMICYFMMSNRENLGYT